MREIQVMSQEEKEMIEDVLGVMIQDYQGMGLPPYEAWEVIDDNLVDYIEDWYCPLDDIESSVQELLKYAHQSFDNVYEQY